MVLDIRVLLLVIVMVMLKITIEVTEIFSGSQIFPSDPLAYRSPRIVEQDWTRKGLSAKISNK